MPYPGLLHPEPLSLQQATANLDLLRRHLNTVLSQSVWGLWVLVCTRLVWAFRVSLVGVGFDSKRDFAPPTILLGLLLCPWISGISSWPLQCHTATTPAPTILHEDTHLLICEMQWRRSIKVCGLLTSFSCPLWSVPLPESKWMV